MADGKDIRTERLTDRKHELRRLMSKLPDSRMRYVEHVEHFGTSLFERVCKMDLEGIVAKHSHGNYVSERERTTWFKIKNRNYSQMGGTENNCRPPGPYLLLRRQFNQGRFDVVEESADSVPQASARTPEGQPSMPGPRADRLQSNGRGTGRCRLRRVAQLETRCYVLVEADCAVT
jgi:hypothetical protein